MYFEMQFSTFISFLFIFNNLLILCTCKKIENPESTTIFDFPHLATLRSRITKLQFCSGAIMGNKYILTSARCVLDENVPQSDIVVFVGTGKANGKGTKYEIAKIEVDPQYTGNITITQVLLHNIAIIELKTPITYHKNKNRIALSDAAIKNNAKAMVVGWGMYNHENLSKPKSLKKLKVTTIDHSRCSNLVNYIVQDGQFCIFKSNKDSEFPGDLGGPLNKGKKLIGIFSYMNRYKENDPILYTSISSSLQFIASILSKK